MISINSSYWVRIMKLYRSKWFQIGGNKMKKLLIVAASAALLTACGSSGPSDRDVLVEACMNDGSEMSKEACGCVTDASMKGFGEETSKKIADIYRANGEDTAAAEAALEKMMGSDPEMMGKMMGLLPELMKCDPNFANME